jgi:hypothetical protein
MLPTWDWNPIASAYRAPEEADPADHLRLGDWFGCGDFGLRFVHAPLHYGISGRIPASVREPGAHIITILAGFARGICGNGRTRTLAFGQGESVSTDQDERNLAFGVTFRRARTCCG